MFNGMVHYIHCIKDRPINYLGKWFNASPNDANDAASVKHTED